MPQSDYELSLVKYIKRRKEALSNERSSFISHWMELSRYIDPRRGRFFSDDDNRGYRVDQDIVNNTAYRALRSASAGMLAGVMSPSRPWFVLELDEPRLSEIVVVGTWLQTVTTLMNAVFSQSNLYSQSQTMLKELLLFGTGCLLHMDDEDDVSRFYAQPAGTYYLAQNDKLKVDTYMREFNMTAGALVEMFGKDRVPFSVQSQYDNGQYDSKYRVVHIIEPRREKSLLNPFMNNMPFRSVYMMLEQGDRSSILRERGFDTFPVYAPRWELTGDDIYGTDCPGMITLGDTKALQIQEAKKQHAIDANSAPPLKASAQLRNTDIVGQPNTIVEYTGGTDQRGVEPVFQVDPRVQELLLDINATEQRIEQGFFVDLFLAFTNINRDGKQYKSEPELIQRNEERLLQLGPVLQQLHGEFLDPLISRTFNQLLERNLIPEPPQEIQGRALNIRYISSLAQAQRAVATGAIERLSAYVGGLAQIDPSAADKLDTSQAIDEYNQAILGPPRILRDDAEVEEIRLQRQEAQEQAQQLAMAQQAADTAATGGKAVGELAGARA